MLDFRNFFETNWYNGKEYRFDNLDQLFKDIAAKEGDQDVLASASVLNKIGIPPRTTNRTPVGMYFYPLYHVLSKGIGTWTSRYIGREYIILVKIVPGAVVLDMTIAGAPDVHSHDFNLETYNYPYKDKLIDKCGGFANYKSIFDEFFLKKGWDVRSNLSILWGVVLGLAWRSGGFDRKGEKPGKHETMPGYGGGSVRIPLSEKATAIFTSLGIDGFHDRGTSTIHPGQPIQVAIFNATKLKPVITIDMTSSKPGGYNPPSNPAGSHPGGKSDGFNPGGYKSGAAF